MKRIPEQVEMFNSMASERWTFATCFRRSEMTKLTGIALQSPDRSPVKSAMCNGRHLLAITLAAMLAGPSPASHAESAASGGIVASPVQPSSIGIGTVVSTPAAPAEPPPPASLNTPAPSPTPTPATSVAPTWDGPTYDPGLPTGDYFHAQPPADAQVQLDFEPSGHYSQLTDADLHPMAKIGEEYPPNSGLYRVQIVSNRGPTGIERGSFLPNDACPDPCVINPKNGSVFHYDPNTYNAFTGQPDMPNVVRDDVWLDRNGKPMQLSRFPAGGHVVGISPVNPPPQLVGLADKLPRFDLHPPSPVAALNNGSAAGSSAAASSAAAGSVLAPVVAGGAFAALLGLVVGGSSNNNSTATSTSTSTTR